MLTGRGSNARAFFQVLAWPLVGTMLLSGVWHGAGYTFIIWGLLHGLYLIANHAWRQYGPRPADPRAPASMPAFVGFLLTFFAVVLAMVVFRAPDMASAAGVFKGMLGLNGVSLPEQVARMIGMPGFEPMMLLDGPVSFHDFQVSAVYIAGLLLIALLMPNSLQMLANYDPVLLTPKRPPKIAGVGPAIYWRPTFAWMGFIAAIAAVSMVWLTGKSEFLYWQF